jgi:hypothetical protein
VDEGVDLIVDDGEYTTNYTNYTSQRVLLIMMIVKSILVVDKRIVIIRGSVLKILTTN